MEKIERIISQHQNYKKYSKPLKAAKVCEVAREVSRGDFEVISYKEGILTCAVSSSGEAASLHPDLEKIAEIINQKLGERAVEKIRIRIKQ